MVSFGSNCTNVNPWQINWFRLTVNNDIKPTSCKDLFDRKRYPWQSCCDALAQIQQDRPRMHSTAATWWSASYHHHHWRTQRDHLVAKGSAGKARTLRTIMFREIMNGLESLVVPQRKRSTENNWFWTSAWLMWPCPYGKLCQNVFLCFYTCMYCICENDPFPPTSLNPSPGT